jgi:hypothetical protein
MVVDIGKLPAEKIYSYQELSKQNLRGLSILPIPVISAT